jgi:3-methyladenine DNA glycosylase/8-oxoguanine DNA glycosylase
MATTSLTVEHPAWTEDGQGRVRLMATGSGSWLATWTAQQGLSLACVAGSEDVKPRVETVSAEELPAATVPALARELALLGTVQRIANPSLWDAVSTAILRQVVRAAQARIVYTRWCTLHGEALDTAAGQLSTVPGPQAVLDLPEAAFKAAGAAFHRTALQAAARAYLDHGTAWAALPPAELVEALDAVPRIGPWTAKAAASDFSGNYAVYPHGDLAVRTWARKAAPDADWRTTDKTFDAAWQATADGPRALHALTLLTLSWGSHVRTEHHGGTAPRP